MAIDRLETIGDASGTDHSAAEDAKARTLLFREEWARSEAPFGVARPGEESRKRRRCGQDDRGVAVLRLDQAQERQGVHARSKAFFRRNPASVGFQDSRSAFPGPHNDPVCVRTYEHRIAISKHQRVLRRQFHRVIRCAGRPAAAFGERPYVGAHAGLGLDDLSAQRESPNPTCWPFSGDDGAPASMPRARARPVSEVNLNRDAYWPGQARRPSP